jgi:hypothetical protein
MSFLLPPSIYANMTYLHLLVKLDDGWPAFVSIDKYLNYGTRGMTAYPRADAADREKDGLLGAIKDEVKWKSRYAPDRVEIAGRTVILHDIQLVFAGKGSPDQIRTAVWLASHYSRTNRGTVAAYCNRFVGLDCNGFASNFWGIDPETEIADYDVNRRTRLADVETGDVLIHYDNKTGKAAHLAVIDTATVKDNTLSLRVVQSAGDDPGLKIDDIGTVQPTTNAKGELNFPIPQLDRTVFIAAGMAKLQPNM